MEEHGMFLGFLVVSDYRRDPQYTSAGGHYLLSHLSNRFNRVSINYRLSPEVTHPGHIKDVCASVKWLKQERRMTRFIVCGHSAGATLAFQLAAQLQKEKENGGLVGIIGVGGIYDLNELVQEYPSYGIFVRNAFGDDEQIWREASPSQFYRPVSSVSVGLIQSKDDELLTWKQTKSMMKVVPDARVESITDVVTTMIRSIVSCPLFILLWLIGLFNQLSNKRILILGL
ncbi:Kynurenine formamidase [Neolecta irregularis DAH-3]|uniref:Kynurenine formamidase n=1 Tax=Neolecta irregularis (strain DAH-3) TaxID=1198029 RepID=A0A1U7LT50_NEOID|nr:Kynurenine formamidase [Neolecta irregularis DAH-3]|eukprot:OLL25691.1 Kynurenine formamidase [Neolecta irregularis DAH-3]